MQKKKKKLKRTSLTTRDFISARRSLSVYGPVIGPFHSRGPSSFFRRVGAVPSTIIISRHDDKRFVETVPLSLSLSRDIALAENSATLSGTKRLREWPRVHTGEENLSIVCLLLFFFFFFRPKTDVESIALFCCRAALRFIAINLPDLSLLVENICVRRGSTTIELIAGNGGGDFFSFFFNLATLRFEPIECFNGSIFVASINPSGQFVSLQNILRAS